MTIYKIQGTVACFTATFWPLLKNTKLKLSQICRSKSNIQDFRNKNFTLNMSCTYKPHFQTVFIEDGTSVDAFHRTQNLVKVQLVPELGRGVQHHHHCTASGHGMQ